MKLIEYHCEVCAAPFEELLSTEEELLPVACILCGSIDTKRVISTPGMIDLKGAGFYENDWKHK